MMSGNPPSLNKPVYPIPMENHMQQGLPNMAGRGLRVLKD